MAKSVPFSMNVNVLVAGEKKSKEVAYQAPQALNITDAVNHLTAHFESEIAERKEKKLDALTLPVLDDNGEIVMDGKNEKTYEASAQDLATAYILNSINKQLRLDVSQPLNVKIREELQGPELQIMKLADDIENRRKKIGKPISREEAVTKARAVFAEE